MKKPELFNKMTRGINRVGFGIRKHSPEILVVSGVVGLVAGTVVACKATTKASKILEQAKKDIIVIHDCAKHPEILSEPYTKEDERKDLAIVYTQTGLKLLKTYAPAIAISALSITSIFTGTNILRKRNLALAAAYTTVDKGFKAYRDRVIERFGDELDKEIRYNVKAVEVEEKIEDKDGKEKTVKKTIKVANPGEEFSIYARCFDNGSEGWTKDPEHNLYHLRIVQNNANELLKAKGYLFLNDVYDMLGIPRSREGQSIGWLYDPKSTTLNNCVDFGIYDIHKEANRDFVNGYEAAIWLDFNVDGPILDFI